MRGPRLAAPLAVLLAAGCAADGPAETGVLVYVEADEALCGRLSPLQVTVEGREVGAATWGDPARETFEVGGCGDWPFVVAVYPDGPGEREFRVTAEAFDKLDPVRAAPVVATRAQVRFANGSWRRLVLTLFEACRHEDGSTCTGAQRCTNEGCGPLQPRSGEDLPPAAGTGPGGGDRCEAPEAPGWDPVFDDSFEGFSDGASPTDLQITPSSRADYVSVVADEANCGRKSLRIDSGTSFTGCEAATIWVPLDATPRVVRLQAAVLPNAPMDCRSITGTRAAMLKFGLKPRTGADGIVAAFAVMTNNELTVLSDLADGSACRRVTAPLGTSWSNGWLPIELVVDLDAGQVSGSVSGASFGPIDMSCNFAGLTARPSVFLQAASGTLVDDLRVWVRR